MCRSTWLFLVLLPATTCMQVMCNAGGMMYGGGCTHHTLIKQQQHDRDLQQQQHNQSCTTVRGTSRLCHGVGCE
jgi:hypothetical protein